MFKNSRNLLTKFLNLYQNIKFSSTDILGDCKGSCILRKFVHLLKKSFMGNLIASDKSNVKQQEAI